MSFEPMETSTTAGPMTEGRELVPRGKWGDLFFRSLTRFFALLVAVLLLGILVSLLRGSLPAFHKFGWGFLTSKEWNPVTEVFGALPDIYGTLVTAGIAMLLGVPISFGIALFITELCPKWLRQPLGIPIQLLAARPSIIYGMGGLFVLAPVLSDHVQPWMTDHLGNWPGIGRLFQGP